MKRVTETTLMPTRRGVKSNTQPLEAASLPDALLNIQTVMATVGLSVATIYRKVATDDFPEPVRLGARCTRWRAADVRAWLAEQAPVGAATQLGDGGEPPTQRAARATRTTAALAILPLAAQASAAEAATQ